MAFISAVVWLAPFLITAVAALGWLDLLRPPPRRKLVTDRRWAVALLLFSAWALIYWGSRLAGPPPGAAHVLLGVRTALVAASLVVGVFILRPSSRDFRRGRRLSKQGDLEGAAAAYRRVIGSGRRDETPRAAFNLGCVLMRHGDLDAAGAAFQQAIDSGQPDIVPAAALNLGWLLERQGDTEGARAAYRRAFNDGPPDVRELAARALGELDGTEADG